MNLPVLQQKTFIVFLVLLTIAFGIILAPFYGAVFWGMVLAILFTPFYRRMLVATRDKPNLAAALTLLVCLVIVILPLTLVTMSLVSEASAVYQNLRSGQLNFGVYFARVIAALPQWLGAVLDRFGLTDLSIVQGRISTALTEGSEALAKQALAIGQNTFDFVISFGIMLYLLFFLLRDGEAIGARIRHVLPLDFNHKRQLFVTFTMVIRATVKGNIIVAAIQGALGGTIFWFLGIQGALLWAVLMGFLSLLPAIGAALIWAPVALYFLITGAVWQGVTLIAFGVLVIGLVDNILRPILVGKETAMPDYIVLLATVGGIALFGLTGFVIGPVIAALFMEMWALFGAEKAADRVK